MFISESICALIAIDALCTWFTQSFWYCSHFRHVSERPSGGTLIVGSHHLSSLWTPFSDSSASFDTYQNSFSYLKFSKQSCETSWNYPTLEWCNSCTPSVPFYPTLFSFSIYSKKNDTLRVLFVSKRLILCCSEVGLSKNVGTLLSNPPNMHSFWRIQ